MIQKSIKTFPILSLIFLSFLPLISFLLEKKAFFIFILLSSIYFTYRTILFSFGSLLGYLVYKRKQKTNWFENLTCHFENLIPLNIFVIPVNSEKYELVKRTIDSIQNQIYDTSKIFIVVSVEEQNYDKFKSDFERDVEKVNNLYLFCHKLNSDESRGAASNRTFGLKSFINLNLISKSDYKTVLVTSPDCDTVLSNQYCAHISYEFLKNGKPQDVFYQASVYKVTNNSRQIPRILRVLNTGLTMSILSTSFVSGKLRYTFSCFTISLNTLIKTDFWDKSLPVDDTPLYWRLWNKTNGRIRCKVIYEPLQVSSIAGDNLMQALGNQYNQYFRWGMGIMAFPIAVEAIIKAQTSFVKKVLISCLLIENIIFIKVFPIVSMISFGLLSLKNTNLPTFVINFLTILSLLNFFMLLIIVFVRLLIYKESFPTSVLKEIPMQLIDIPLGFINLIIFGFIPYLIAYFSFAIKNDINMDLKWADKYD